MLKNFSLIPYLDSEIHRFKFCSFASKPKFFAFLKTAPVSWKGIYSNVRNVSVPFGLRSISRLIKISLPLLAKGWVMGFYAHYQEGCSPFL
jgi:hypothetical protein